MPEYKTERILLATDEEYIEGVVHHPSAIRLSDAFNAPQHHETPFVVMTDATMLSRETGAEILKSRVLLVLRSTIRIVAPRSEVTWLGLTELQSSPASKPADASSPPEDTL